ncbi:MULTISPECIES: DnaB-like helicase C-terminal domain-containing protein [Streptomyces rochei group]|uniref:DnaB-like helicase C-terminal domain-containing protein n=1 Tax=Streptomyces rochei group TaxID=2867164 RepID=UPI00187456FD|nr:DnaB-like helicase C-terminal domain-containing protein [Streptomyces vinaceusdrappus]
MSTDQTDGLARHTDGLIGDLMSGVLDDIESVSIPNPGPQETNSLSGIATGFTELDEVTGGNIDGRLMVIASRPGLGRSTLLTDMCRHAAIKLNIPVAAYTLEESRSHFITRIKCAEARIPRLNMHNGTMQEEHWTRLARVTPKISAAPLWIKSPASLTMRQLRKEATELVQDHGVRLLAVDGIQDIRPEKRSDLREREVGDIVRDLKTLARELNVPIIATSHLNRSPEQRWDKKPMLDDLRESGAITFAADVLILLHREDAYDKESPRAGEADLILAKHRNGPTRTVTVAFQGHYGRFVDMAQT